MPEPTISLRTLRTHAPTWDEQLALVEAVEAAHMYRVAEELADWTGEWPLVRRAQAAAAALDVALARFSFNTEEGT